MYERLTAPLRTGGVFAGRSLRPGVTLCVNDAGCAGRVNVRSGMPAHPGAGHKRVTNRLERFSIRVAEFASLHFPSFRYSFLAAFS